MEAEESGAGRDVLGAEVAAIVAALGNGARADCGAAGVGIAPTGGTALPNGSLAGRVANEAAGVRAAAFEVPAAAAVSLPASAASGSSAAAWRTA